MVSVISMFDVSADNILVNADNSEGGQMSTLNEVLDRVAVVRAETTKVWAQTDVVY